MSRTFEDKPAVRAEVPLLIGIMGPSGGGKTFSALRLATGIQQVTGGDIYCVDTEAKRALHYADFFKFRHLEFKAPFSSLDYLAAIEYCVGKGAKVVIIDSFSHEHSGPGGYLECADAELHRMAGDDYRKQQACKLASFIKCAGERRQMIDRILQLNANFIFCFRAKDKVKPIKREGKTEIENIGFMPIAAPELVFEMTACCLLLPHAGGVPTWASEEIGERMMIKTAQQFAELFKGSRPLDEEHGRKLAEWARGGKPAAPSTYPDGWELWSNEERGENRSMLGTAALADWWKSLTSQEQKSLTAKKDAWKATAASVKP